MRKLFLVLLLSIIGCNIPDIKLEDVGTIDESGVCHVAVVVPATCDDQQMIEEKIDEQIPQGVCVIYICSCTKHIYCKLN
jgi:hypothetical protein